MPFYERPDVAPNIEDREVGITNRWNWTWLDRTCADDQSVSNWCKKPKTPGKAFCRVCNCEVDYREKGAARLIDHAKGKKHQERLKVRSFC